MREYTFGRHWTHESMFVSRLNRESIDLLKVDHTHTHTHLYG